MATSDTEKQLTIEEIEAHLGLIRPNEISQGHLSLIAKNAVDWAREVSAGPFWVEAEKRLLQWRTEFRQLYGGDLLSGAGLPSFQSKSESSIKDKLLRRCKGDID